MSLIRTFIAIELDPAANRALGSIQAQLKKSPDARHVKWVVPGGIHLTLKFIGDMDSARVPAVLEAIRHASAGAQPFGLGLGTLGAFPNLNRPNVIWVGLTGETETAVRIARRLEDECAALGIAREERPFSPHLTLGRVRREAGPDERRLAGDGVRRLGEVEPVRFIVDAVYLMRSDLKPSGAVYSVLGQVPIHAV